MELSRQEDGNAVISQGPVEINQTNTNSSNENGLYLNRTNQEPEETNNNHKKQLAVLS